MRAELQATDICRNGALSCARVHVCGSQTVGMQLALKDAFCGAAGGSEGRGTGRVKFVDLFCGCGGASSGAVDAGYEVVLAVDVCEYALSVHRVNHVGCVHICTTLPPSEPLPLPADGCVWHLHGSPPCTRVSKAYQQRDSAERQNALAIIEWYTRFAVFSSATSWSMEQVATPVVIECLQQLSKCLARTRFDYEVIDLMDIGVPQHRKRVIAGSPDVVSRVRRLARWRQSVKDVIPFPRATHLRTYMMNSNPKPDPTGNKKWVYKRYSDDEACKPITDPAPTVVARHFFRWAFPNTDSKLVLFSVGEMASLQTFPHGYFFGDKKRKAMRCIGNALPPLAMQQILSGRKPSRQRTQKRSVLADPASPSYDRRLHATFKK